MLQNEPVEDQNKLTNNLELQPTNLRQIRLAFWLIRLRWYYIIGIVVAYSIAKYILHITIWGLPINSVVLFLIIYNSLSFFYLRHLKRSHIRRSLKVVNRMINFQISTDLIALTVLLHFSGGVENPGIIFYIFHMIIGSYILSTKESILQTTFALLLVGSMTFLEYTGIIPHYPLEGFIITNMYSNLTYIICTGVIFVITSYFIVYIIRTVIRESTKHEIAYLNVNHKLRQKDKIKNEYVVRITHDIKGHITAIQSCINVLHEKITGPLNQQQEEFVNRAHVRIEILNQFISDLLNITKIKLQQKYDKKYFDLNHSIEEVLKIAEENARNKDIIIVQKIDPSISKIFGEQSSIEEVIINLILNAIKYSPPGKNVTLSAEDKQDKVLIEVTDKGIGIPENEIDLIFNEFYRASNVKTQIKDGTGLGLTISKEIVESHGGKIWVKSNIGIGTTFSFLLKKER
ncbi:MAG: HAMP domain-containing histidine kinase [Bacteroidetes bacterium]|nr:HAMP domain-containing histidine kinase [Bacteroidota bacterium]